MKMCRSARNVAAAALLTAGLIQTDSGCAGARAQEPTSSAQSATTYLMSKAQYKTAIAQVFGNDIRNDANLPPLRRRDGLLAVSAGTALVTPGAFEAFDRGAREIANQVVDAAHRDILIPCKPANESLPDDGCAREFFGPVGRLLFRRPLTGAELEGYVAMAHEAGEKVGGFYPGLAHALSGMLTAPQFIFFVEDVEPDPAKPGQMRLDGFAKATRLSVLLWHSLPDSQLLKAAESGEIHTPRGLKREVDRMLASSRVKNGVRAFFEDMLVLDAFDSLAKDPEIYPAFTQLVVLQTKEQLLRTIEDQLVTRGGDYRDLFTTRDTFITLDLAALYKIPLDTSERLQWFPYRLPENDPRGGILTQIAFLSSYAHPGRSSATRRGKALREVFMCQTVPDPPPNVDFSGFEDPTNVQPTMRGRLDAHSQNPVCAGCHKITDPIGLALEKFDGAGQYRATENGAQIDTTGTFEGKKFADARELGEAVRNSPAVGSCLVKRLYEYSMHRRANDADKPVLAALDKAFEQNAYRFVELMRSMATSEGFFRVDGKTAHPESSSHE